MTFVWDTHCSLKKSMDSRCEMIVSYFCFKRIKVRRLEFDNANNIKNMIAQLLLLQLDELKNIATYVCPQSQ